MAAFIAPLAYFIGGVIFGGFIVANAVVARRNYLLERVMRTSAYWQGRAREAEERERRRAA